MSNETVTVGDTEVLIEETDDGFEVTEVEDEAEAGLYLRATGNNDNYGFEVPLNGNYEFATDYDGYAEDYHFAWDTDEDISDMKSDGYKDRSVVGGDRDGHAGVNKPEIVVRE